MVVVTVAERKARKIEQLRVASQQAMEDLRAYAADNGGRFVVVGSIARDDFTYDSDFEVLVDFPLDPELAATDYAEATCWRLGLKPDAIPKPWESRRVRARVERDGVVPE